MSRDNGATMTVLQHLAELRCRLMAAGAAFLAAASACFAAAEPIRRFLVRPAGELTLVYFSPPEAFTAQLKLALLAGAVLSSPVILYEILAFIYPALTPFEKKTCLRALTGIALLFCGGAAFSYLAAFPLVLRFLLDYAGGGASPKLSIGEYISFFFSFHVFFGFIFQLPLAAWALGRLDLVRAPLLRRGRKYALLVILILAAVLTPPDPFTQLLLALPLLLLYELCIFMAAVGCRSRIKEMAPQ
ncbi:twin-arginine translocase subunit TatC [Candidatus Darwinibacter acetoxidans]